MQSSIQLLVSILLLIVLPFNTIGGFQVKKTVIPVISGYIFVNGQTLPKGNPVEDDGIIYHFNAPVLQMMRTASKTPKGIILLLPGGDYKVLKMKGEGEKIAWFLNGQGYNVAILEYHIGMEPEIRRLALTDAQKAFRIIEINHNKPGFQGERRCIMGISSGGHLAARVVQKLTENEQPDDLILINPSDMDETVPGTVFPSVLPPVQPTARLFCAVSASGLKASVKSCEEYTKTWKGYDGISSFYLLQDSTKVSVKNSNLIDNSPELAALLKNFLGGMPEIHASGVNPAAIPVEGYAKKRHEAKLELIAKEKFDMVFIGNSITHNFEKPEYQPVWNQFYAPRKALNLGTSAYRTENIIWNIRHGELDGQLPKVIVLEIGTNNVDEKNYPTRHTAGQLAGGIEAIVRQLREKLPETKIIILRCFPGCYGGPNPTSHRLILERASYMVSRLADGKHVFYCDVNHVFLNLDGSINHEMMPDWLHPSPAGAKAWAQAMEPLLSELMADKSLDTDKPANTAIVPASKLENDSYNWWNRHAEIIAIKDSIDPEIVLIGNSITHFWGGKPNVKYADGRARIPNGPKSWSSLFGSYRVLNLGFGWDRTQNVLWRLDHGELDGLHPRTVIINIGTNNTTQTSNARMNTASEIVDGIRAICTRVRSKVPGTKIILMAVFPREQSPAHPRRVLINEINRQLEAFAREQKITLVDIGPGMLTTDGTLTKEIASDFCHPTEKGYQIWADAIRSLIAEP